MRKAKSIGVDPAGTGTGDEAGIVVVGRGTADRHAYVLADLSGQMTARETGLAAWQAFYDHGAAYLVYEDNFGKQWLRDGLIDAFADHHQMDRDARDAVKGTDAELYAQAGEELTFNYGYDLTDYKNHPCVCGAKKCVGFMAAEEYFPKIRKQRRAEAVA